MKFVVFWTNSKDSGNSVATKGSEEGRTFDTSIERSVLTVRIQGIDEVGYLAEIMASVRGDNNNNAT